MPFSPWTLPLLHLAITYFKSATIYTCTFLVLKSTSFGISLLSAVCFLLYFSCSRFKAIHSDLRDSYRTDRHVIYTHWIKRDNSVEMMEAIKPSKHDKQNLEYLYHFTHYMHDSNLCTLPHIIHPPSVKVLRRVLLFPLLLFEWSLVCLRVPKSHPLVLLISIVIS